MNRTRKTSIQMFPLIEKYLSSEQNQLEFCEANGIALHVLGYWLKQYREQDKNKTSPSFANHVEIHFPNGMQIKIPINC